MADRTVKRPAIASQYGTGENNIGIDSNTDAQYVYAHAVHTYAHIHAYVYSHTGSDCMHINLPAKILIRTLHVLFKVDMFFL